MKIKITHNFFDRENALQLREAGEEMEVTEKRGSQLIAMKLAEEIPAMTPPQEAAGEENPGQKAEKKPAARKKPKKTEEA